MNKKYEVSLLQIVLGGAVLLLAGAAYGPIIPGVKQVAPMLPGSKAL